MNCNSRVFVALFAICGLGLASCASHRPVLYPNDHLNKVGRQAAEADIADCMAQAEQYVASGGEIARKGQQVAKGTAAGAAVGAATGAVGGAVSGDAGRGAAVGAATGATAGFTGSLLGVFGDSSPSPAYRGFVERCLRDRGYEPIGWE